MTLYTNQHIQWESLPRWEDIPFESISPRYKFVIWINTLIVLIFMSAAVFSFVFWVLNQGWVSALISVGVLTLFIAAYLIFNLISFRRRSYSLRENDVLYKAGVFNHYTLIIPFKHIQHVKIGSTLISRSLGLVSIDLYTAGSGRDMRISGLSLETGQRLQQHISTRISKIKSGEEPFGAH